MDPVKVVGGDWKRILPAINASAFCVVPFGQPKLVLIEQVKAVLKKVVHN